jgi:hypothetical protein
VQNIFGTKWTFINFSAYKDIDIIVYYNIGRNENNRNLFENDGMLNNVAGVRVNNVTRTVE